MDNTTLIIIAVLLFLLMSNRCKENFYNYKDKTGKNTYGLSKKKILDKNGNVVMKHVVNAEHCKKNIGTLILKLKLMLEICMNNKMNMMIIDKCMQINVKQINTILLLLYTHVLYKKIFINKIKYLITIFRFTW